jgi:hypothetical protein
VRAFFLGDSVSETQVETTNSSTEPSVAVAGDGSEKESDDRQQQALSTFQDELARLSGKLEGIAEVVKSNPTASASATPQTKNYTRSHLRELVNAGTITEDQMDEQLEIQLRESITANAEAQTDAKLQKATIQGKVLGQIDSYMERNPKLKDKSSPVYQRVKKAFDELVELGDDAGSMTTELKALKIALGPNALMQGKRKEPDTFEDTGGSGSAERSDESDSGWAKGLNAGQRDYYKTMLTKGLFKSSDDPNFKAEIEIARKKAA